MSQSVLVLDLDATLVDTYGGDEDWLEVEGENRPVAKSRIFSISSNDTYMMGAKRPGLESFLSTAFDVFDVVGVWSAGSKCYVDQVILDVFKSSPRSPDFVWSKDDCPYGFIEHNETYVRQKPLVLLWDQFPHFDPKRTILVDDAEDVCAQNPLNHILIPPWNGKLEALHKEDNVLPTLTKWMREKLPGCKDFRAVGISLSY